MINPFKYFTNRKVGLVLGSGGSKGAAHISVLECIDKMGIPIDIITGSSIGSLIGAVYCAGSIKEFKKDLLGMNKDGIKSLFDPVFPRSGLLAGKSIMKYLERYIPRDMNIEDMNVPLVMTATNYYTGKTIIFRSGNVLEAVRASISMPGIFVPVKYRSTYLIDGGVANPIPINVCKRLGAGIIIAVNLHKRINEKKFKKYLKSDKGIYEPIVDSTDIEIVDENEDVSLPNDKTKTGWFKSIEKWIGINGQQKEKAPNIFDMIMRTIDIMEYVNTMLMLKYNTPAVLIEPDVTRFTSMQFDKALEIIKEGDIACEKVKGQLISKVLNRI